MRLIHQNAQSLLTERGIAAHSPSTPVLADVRGLLWTISHVRLHLGGLRLYLEHPGYMFYRAKTEPKSWVSTSDGDTPALLDEPPMVAMARNTMSLQQLRTRAVILGWDRNICLSNGEAEQYDVCRVAFSALRLLAEEHDTTQWQYHEDAVGPVMILHAWTTSTMIQVG